MVEQHIKIIDLFAEIVRTDTVNIPITKIDLDFFETITFCITEFNKYFDNFYLMILAIIKKLINDRIKYSDTLY